MERLQNTGASLVTQSDPSRPSTSSSFQHWDETSQTAVSLKKLLGINLTMPTLLHTFFKIFLGKYASSTRTKCSSKQSSPIAESSTTSQNL